MDATPTDAELAEWLYLMVGPNTSGTRLTPVAVRLERTIRALQDAREQIAELETEIADMRGNVRKDLLARLRGD